jgi:predicted nuclease with TOPRIM domain
MENRQKLELMYKIIRELEDLKNSQTAVLKKLSQIEADNINLGEKILDEHLPGIHEEVDAGVEKVSALLEKFTEVRDAFELKNPVPATETL